MSSYDETGNGAHWCKTNAAAGVECDSCLTNIAKCEGGKLYAYSGSWLCRSCAIENIFDDLDVIEADDPY